MAVTLKPKRSNTSGTVPTTAALADGELAVNTADRTIFMRQGTNILRMGGSKNQFGIYSARPAASSANTDVLYYASDTQEIYLSDGSSWSRVGITSGRIAGAERATPYTTTANTFAVIPTMTVTFPVGEVPAGVMYGGTMRSGLLGSSGVMAPFCDGVQIGQILVSDTAYSSYAGYATLPAGTPGASRTVELRARHSVAGTAFDVFGDPADKMYLRVVPN